MASISRHAITIGEGSSKLSVLACVSPLSSFDMGLQEGLSTCFVHVALVIRLLLVVSSFCQDLGPSSSCTFFSPFLGALLY